MVCVILLWAHRSLFLSDVQFGVYVSFALSPSFIIVFLFDAQFGVGVSCVLSVHYYFDWMFIWHS